MVIKLVDPKAEIIDSCFNKSQTSHIAKCAAVCYGKENVSNATSFCDKLLKSGHISVFRHGTLYLKTNNYNYVYAIEDFVDNPYYDIRFIGEWAYVVVNYNTYFDLENRCNSGEKHRKYFTMLDFMSNCAVDVEEFKKAGLYDMIRYTIKLTTSISCSREINRVSPNNIVERSTRYVKADSITKNAFILEDKIVKDMCEFNTADIMDANTGINPYVAEYLYYVGSTMSNYKEMCNVVHKQIARGLLPLDTTTEVIYTYSVKEWRHIIDLRHFETTGKAHPDAKYIIGLVKEILEKEGYNFNN